jgi:hypothetical protein
MAGKWRGLDHLRFKGGSSPPPRPATSRFSLRRLANVARPVGCRGVQGRAASREDADETDGDRGALSSSADHEARAGAQDLSLSPARDGNGNRLTIGGWTPTSLAIDRVLRPSAANRTIRARFKSRCNVTGERQRASNTLRSFRRRRTSLASGIIPTLNHDSRSKKSGYSSRANCVTRGEAGNRASTRATCISRHSPMPRGVRHGAGTE